MGKTTMLRNLLAKEKIVVAPGAYDCLSARIIERLGFKVVYVTGFGSEASLLGMPDIGQTTMSEMVRHCGNIASAVDVPVVCDADIGWGGPLQVYRAVGEFIKAGVAGIHLEDQTNPKVCPVIAPPDVIPMEEYIVKLRAAIDARNVIDKDFVIVARTDSAARYGLEEAIRRGNAYAEAGADLIFVAGGGPTDKERTKHYVDSMHAPIFAVNSQLITAKEYEDIGVKMLILPTTGIMAAAKAVMGVYQEFKTTGKVRELFTVPEFTEIVGLPKWAELDKKYKLPSR